MRFLTILVLIFCVSIKAHSQSNAFDSIPVRISSLEAKTAGNDARLDWKVVCYLTYAKFEIQRSTNGMNYTTINTFEADQVRCREPFAFTDANSTGKSFYRIRVGDLDGKFYHSKIVAVIGKERSFEINSLTPSIVVSHALLSISSASNNKNAELVIRNLQGIIIKRLAINVKKGVTEVPIVLTDIPKGNYVLTITNSVSEIKTTRFIKL